MSTTDPNVMKATLAKLFQGMQQLKGSDLHLRAEAPPFVRVDGALSRANLPALSAEDLEQALLLTSGRTLEQITRADFEYSYDAVGVGRFRGHAFRENGRWALTFRIIPTQVPAFAELRLPAVVKVLSERAPGLTLIVGPTGSGKTTTAAAMLRYLAMAECAHIVTIEDPIEYRLTDTKSCVSQRELGRDTPNYTDALKAVLREDPDLIFLGEIRDPESLMVALQAGETGHSVIATFHTGNATQTIQRLLGMFSPEDQVMARERLADTLRGIICQRLMPRKGTRGRVLVTEVLVNNYSVRECLRDPGKLKSLHAVLERSKQEQMHTLDQDLVALVREGLVDAEVAVANAASPQDMRRNLTLQGRVG